MAVGAILSLCLENLTTVFIFAVTLLMMLYLTGDRRRRRRALPPGPLALPVIGNLHNLLSRDILGKLRDLRQQYGDVYRVYTGQELMIVLNGYDSIHGALVKKGGLFARRPETPFHKIIDDKRAIVFANDPVWKQQRSFAQRALQEFGLSSTAVSIEDRINQQVDILVAVLENVDEPLDVRCSLSASMCNIVTGMLLGKTFQYEDSTLERIIESINKVAVILASVMFLLNAFPLMRLVAYLPGDILQMNKMRRLLQFPKDFYAKSFDKGCKEFSSENINTFTDLFIKEMKGYQAREEDSSFKLLTYITFCSDMVGAGTETSATTIRWLILYILKNPEIRKKLQKDIDEVLGRERRPTLADRARLPYVEATIMETLRIAPVAPLAIPHSVPHDVMFQGHLIPENASVVVNIQSVLKDPNVWSDPDEFRPERFLKEDGSVHAPKEFIPFSLGRRSCLGESLARMELFLYTTRLLQKFEFRVPDGDPVPESEGVLGITYSPKPFTVKVEKR